MSTDIANISDMEIPGAGEAYEAPSDFFKPVNPTAKGEVTLIIPADTLKDEQFKTITDYNTKAAIPGFSVFMKWKVVGGQQDGKVFFADIDTRQFSTRNGNRVQDYLLNSTPSFTGRLLSVDDYKNALQQHTAVVPSVLGWKADKCVICEKYPKLKQTDFLRPNGTYYHVAACPDCGEGVGARVKIVTFKAKK